LPKQYRNACVPVPEFVTSFLEHAEIGESSLLQALTNYIQFKTTLKLGLEDFNLANLPPHSYMNFSVIDDNGRELGMSRDWLALKRQLGQAAQLTFRSTSPDIEKIGLKHQPRSHLVKMVTNSQVIQH